MSKPKNYGLASVQRRLEDSTKLLLIAAEIEKARQNKQYVAYLTLAKLTGLFSGGLPLAKLLGILFEMDIADGLAPRTALVVHNTNGQWGEPGGGFFDMCIKHGLLEKNAPPDLCTKAWEQLRDSVWEGSMLSRSEVATASWAGYKAAQGG